MALSASYRSPLQFLVFLAAAAACFPLASVLGSLIGGLAGMGASQAASAWLFPGIVCVLLLGATWGGLRSDRSGLRALGLVPTRRRVTEFGMGFVMAAVIFVVVALVRAASVGAGWVFDPVAGARAALVGLPLSFILLFPEELLFRGFAFRKAEELWGASAALAASSLAFGAYHVVGSGYSGTGALWLFVTPALGGLLFGLAALRTRGLALPTGLHLGANWINASIFGLGFERGDALWSAPLTGAQIAHLTAPDVLPHLPYLTAVGLLTTVVAVRFRSTTGRAATGC